MTDTLISTARVYLSGGGASGYGSVPAPTAEQISNAEAAIAAMSVDIDTLLTANVTVYLVPQSFFNAQTPKWSSSGDTAWGYTPQPGKAFVATTTADGGTQSLAKQRYSILHEIGHTIDSAKGVVANHAKHAAIGALMRPAPDQSVSGWWGNGTSKVRPNENFADTIPRAYAGMGDVTGGYYTRPIPASSYPAFMSTVGGASLPASTTLAADAAAGAINIKVASVTGLNAGDWIVVNDVESHSIATRGTSGVGGTGLTLDTPLTGTYFTGSSVVETSAPPDVSSGDIHLVLDSYTGNNQYQSVTFDRLALGATGTAKLRFSDGTAVGPYSDSVRVALPSPVSAGLLTVTPGTLTPNLGVSLIGPPAGVYIVRWFLSVYQSVAGGDVLKWQADADMAFGTTVTRLDIPYAGDQLYFDETYTFRFILVAGSFDASGTTEKGTAISPWGTFTPTIDAGPVITYSGALLDTSYKINTLTPTFRLAPRNGGSIDEARLRLWYRTKLLYDSGLVGPFSPAAYRDVAIPSGYIQPGMDVDVEGFVRVSGNTSPSVYSDKATIHFNVAPGAPSPVTVRSDEGEVVGPGSDVYRRVGRTDNIWVSSVPNPIIVFPYRDTDRDLGYVDNPTRREVELRDLSDNHVGSSPYVITSGITDEWQTPDLTADTTFKARADYDDNAGARGAFSEYGNVRYSAPPVISNVSPSSGVLIDPTPSLTWDFSGTQKTVDLFVYLDDALVWTYRRTTATRYVDIPSGVFNTGQSISYTLIVRNTDGLAATAFGNFTTAFTVPDALTGLVLTVDTASDAIEVEWDASTDPVFEAYNVYTRQSGQDWTLVRRITDQDTTFLTLYAAPWNKEIFIRVVQTNGWRESDPAEDSAELGGDEGTVDFIRGYGLIRPEQALRYPMGKHETGDTVTDLEMFEPPGRGEPVVLNWGTRGYQGSLSLFQASRDDVETLRSWKEEDFVAILKTWYGAVRYVRLTSTPDTDQPAWWDQSVAYREVTPVEF